MQKNKFIREDVKTICSMARKLTALGFSITLCSGSCLYANAQYNLNLDDISTNETLAQEETTKKPNDLETHRRNLIANLGIDRFADGDINTLLDIVDALRRTNDLDETLDRQTQFVLARHIYAFPETLTPADFDPLLDVTLEINKLKYGN